MTLSDRSREPHPPPTVLRSFEDFFRVTMVVDRVGNTGAVLARSVVSRVDRLTEEGTECRGELRAPPAGAVGGGFRVGSGNLSMS